jgi:hypothetical protein
MTADKSDRAAIPRREFIKRSATALVASSLPASYETLAQLSQSNDAQLAAADDVIPVRAITAGVNVTTDSYAEVFADANDFLVQARGIVEAQGFPVQTTRITTQPHAFYMQDVAIEAHEDILKDMRDIAEGHLLAVGPGIVDDQNDPAAIQKTLVNTALVINSTMVIGTRNTGIHYRAIDAAAETIKQLSETDPIQNYAFAAIANVPPEVPFFPGGYHGKPYNSFTVGPEAANLFMRVCRDVGDLQTAEQALLEAYTPELESIEKACLTIQETTGWKFEGIDPTPAQWGERSIGTAVESLTHAPFGSPGTLAACRTMTSVIKKVPVSQTGYRGLFLPPMEDTTLARRAYDHFGLDELLSYSAVCGTGLDVAALPGDTTVEELRRILIDVASLAIQLDKPLTARLLPIPGKAAGQSTGPLGNLYPMKVLSVR